MVSCKAKVSYEEVARERAVATAQALIAIDHNNTIKLEQKILEAKSIQSEFLMQGDTIAAQAFDSAFREYVMMNDEFLAKELFE